MADYGILRPLPPVQVPDIAGEFQKGMETGRQNAARRLLVPAMKGDQDAMDKLGDLSPDAYMKISEWRRSASDQQRKQAQAGAQYMDKVAAGADQMSDQELPQFYAAAVAGAQQMGMDVSGIPQLSDPGQIRNYIKMTHRAFKETVKPYSLKPGEMRFDEDNKPVANAPYVTSPHQATMENIAQSNHDLAQKRFDTLYAATQSPDDIDYNSELYRQTGKVPPKTTNAQLSAYQSRARELQQMADAGQDMPKGAQSAWGTVNSRFDTAAAGKMVSDFKGGGKHGDMVRSAGVAFAHILQMGDLAHALQNHETVAVNKIVNQIRTWNGSANATNFDWMRNVAMDEAAKFIVGGQFTQGDREEFKDGVSNSSSPTQIGGLVDTAKGAMAAQMVGLGRQYRAGTKRNDFGTLVDPRALQEMRAHGYTDDTGSGDPGSGAPAATSPDQNDIATLRANPALAPRFDARFGAGSAQHYLGQ